ncbi:MAG: MBL fold metallo-hydrolase, partial [Candidatus Pacebacteria bacterium]|nr:MBL fold metallo-hydrolase [Candidatus Paceibacterota bacterium]
YELLIDGGSSAAVLRELSDGRNFFDKKIDVVVATHPDADHVGGLVDVLERYEVGLIIESAVVHETTVSDAFDDAANNEGLDIVIAQAGQIIKLGASTTVRILSPYGDSANWNSNSASVIVQIVYGDIEFMLTGDAPKGIEEYLVGEFGELLESEVMKLGHHGSKTSSAETFLDAVSPEFAVVSAALDNRYGHPHPEVIERVEEREIEIVSTAVEGTIAFESDGREVWLVE